MPPREEKPTVENRWWAEVGKAQGGPPPAKKGAGLVGDKFYRVAEGYDQQQALENLTDLNLRLIEQARPEEGRWAYIQMLDERVPRREIERIQREVHLPGYARGVIVDCGRSLRLLVTGTPPGERVLDLTLVSHPSFDCWIGREWVKEETYPSTAIALHRFRRQIRYYLSPESIAEQEGIRPRA